MNEARISRVARMDNRVAPFDWPFASQRASDIEAHWAVLKANKPALFDGRVFMGRETRIDPERDGAFVSAHFETAFSAFLSWRDFGFPDMQVRNVFSMGALRSGDGAFLLGEMDAHTANAGKCYFPAGTPALRDVRDGMIDLAGSVTRELMEETGLDARDGRVDPFWSIVELGPRIACMRPILFEASAEEIIARVADDISRQRDPELAGLRAVRSMADLALLETPEFIQAYLAHEFARG